MADEEKELPSLVESEHVAKFVPMYEEQAANDILLVLLQKHYAPSTIYPLQDDRPAISIGYVGLMPDNENYDQYDVEQVGRVLEYLGLPLDTPYVLDRNKKKEIYAQLIFIGNFKIKEEYKRILECNVCTEKFQPLTVDKDNFMCIDCDKPVCLRCSEDHLVIKEEDDDIPLKYYVHCYPFEDNEKVEKCNVGKYNFSTTCSHIYGCESCLSSKIDKCSTCEKQFCKKCIDYGYIKDASGECVLDVNGNKIYTRSCCSYNNLCIDCLDKHNEDTTKLKQLYKEDDKMVCISHGNNPGCLEMMCSTNHKIIVCNHNNNFMCYTRNSLQKCIIKGCTYENIGGPCVKKVPVKCITTDRTICSILLCCGHKVEDFTQINKNKGKHKKIIEHNYCYLHQDIHYEKTWKCAKCKKSCCKDLMKSVNDSNRRSTYNVCMKCHLRIFLIGRCILNRIVFKPGSRYILKQFAEFENDMKKKEEEEEEEEVVVVEVEEEVIDGQVKPLDHDL